MIFILYLVVFLGILAWRRHNLTGGFLEETYVAEKQQTYLDTKTNKRRNSFTQHYGLMMKRRIFFSIMPERWYHRTLKFMGLATEIEIGDAELDKKLFFVSDAPEQFQQLFKTAEQRRTIVTLFDTMKIEGLRAFGDKIWLSCDGAANAPGHRNERLALLWQIARDVETLPPSWDSEIGFKSFGFPHFAMLFMACHAAFLVIGLGGWVPASFEDVEIVNWPRLITLSLFTLPFLPVIWLILIRNIMGRGNAWTSLVIIDFILIGLVGIGATGFIMLRELNIRLDYSRPHVVAQPVMDKACSLKCSRRSGKRTRTSTYPLSESQCRADQVSQTLATYEARDYKCRSSATFNYKVYLKPWADYQHKPFALKVDNETFDRTRRLDLYQVPVYDGAFGAAWVDTEEVTRMEK